MITVAYELQYSEVPVAEAGKPAERRLLPSKPTDKMIAAGSKAGPVSMDVAWKIYRAMFEAAQTSSP
ncbi:hypothetical protein KXR53_27505 [Inquilinus limosus]|uniref:hypothetical protein n=1 Tax=Inquilinus limosus TaxID=171674 RepID=UPI003F142260